MTVKELIQDEDFDYINIRLTCPTFLEKKMPAECRTADGAIDYARFPENAIFADSAKSEGGRIISSSGDSWGGDEEVAASIRWTDEENDIQNGLTLVLQSEWYPGKRAHTENAQ